MDEHQQGRQDRERAAGNSRLIEDRQAGRNTAARPQAHRPSRNSVSGRRTAHRHRRYKRGKALYIALGIRAAFALIVLLLAVGAIRGIAGMFRHHGQQQAEESTEEASSAEEAAAPEETQNPNIVTSNGRQLDLTKPMVAVTFDDGPYASVGNQIMDTLAQCGGKATFFVVGNRAEKYTDELKRMAGEGHEIGNHSYDHDEKLSKKDAKTIAWEFNSCDEEINKVAGVTPAVYRLPGGINSDTVRKTLTKPLISWSVDTEDWKTRNAQATVNAVVGHVRDGDIILMHELYQSTADACKTILPELVNEGYQLVTVSELIQYRSSGPLEQGVQYTDFHPKSGDAQAASSGTPTVDVDQETAGLAASAEESGSAAAPSGSSAAGSSAASSGGEDNTEN